MPKVLKIKDVEEIKAEIQNHFSVDEDARFVRRLDVALLLCNKHSINNVADLFDINPTTIQRWVRRLNEFGFEGLRDKPGRGRRSLLSEADRIRLKKDIEKPPKDFGYQQGRWDGKLLSHHLKNSYSVELKVRQCQILFKKLGFSLQRPRKMPDGGDPEKQEAFKKNSK
jgi:transposase